MLPHVPRIGVHLPLASGLLRAAERAREIGADTIQVFADNPTTWQRRAAPPPRLPEFRARLGELDIRPVAIHASYLVNLAGPDPGFRRASIEVLASELRAAAGYGARIVNVHTGSHRETTLDAGIDRIAEGVAEVFGMVDGEAPGTILVLENASGGGASVGVTLEESARIADAAAALGVDEGRVGFCIDTAHAWGAGIGVDEPEAIDAYVERFDELIGLRRLALVHLNDSRDERGSRHDRHEHLGGGAIGERGLGHFVRHPALVEVPFILETPGMDSGYDAINLDRARSLATGEPLEPLPPEAFEVSSSGHRSAAPG